MSFLFKLKTNEFIHNSILMTPFICVSELCHATMPIRSVVWRINSIPIAVPWASPSTEPRYWLALRRSILWAVSHRRYQTRPLESVPFGSQTPLLTVPLRTSLILLDLWNVHNCDVVNKLFFRRNLLNKYSSNQTYLFFIAETMAIEYLLTK